MDCKTTSRSKTAFARLFPLLNTIFFIGKESLLKNLSAVPKMGVLFLFLAVLTSPLSTFGQTVTTDKLDYLPGETAYASGSGWGDSEVITLSVHEEPVYHDDVITTITADEYGNFSNVAIYEFELHDYGSSYTLTATGLDPDFETYAYFTDGPSIDQLYQWANTDFEWQFGNLGTSNSTYQEGNTVPYYAPLSDLIPGQVYTIEILWDVTKSGKHAIDYLTTYNSSYDPINPAIQQSFDDDGFDFVADDTEPIPLDTFMQSYTGTTWSGTQESGVFTIWNGTFVDATGSSGGIATSSYTYSTPANYIGDKTTSIQITFKATEEKVIIAWGGHIGSQVNWGFGNSAGEISGSPFHMATTDLFIPANTCPSSPIKTFTGLNVGQRDRSLSAAAVTIPGTITVTKDAQPDDAVVFDFTASAPSAPISVINGLLDINNDGVIDSEDTGKFNGTDVNAGSLDIINTTSYLGSGPSAIDVINGALDINNDGNIDFQDDGFATASVEFNFTLVDDGTNSKESTILLFPASWTITELNEDNWTLTEINTTGDSSAANAIPDGTDEGSVTLTVSEAHVTSVTFVNTIDCVSPVITCPSDVTLECDASTNPSDTGMATATEGCGIVTIDFTDSPEVGTCANESIITRTWTATDDAGNTVTCDQIITVDDTTAPTFDSEPATIADITCDAALPVQEVLTASDTCGNATVTPSVDDYTVDVCAGYAITYRWTAEDDCGNTAVTTATFNVLPDEIDPTFDAQPTAIGNITCIDDLPVQEVLTASDTCGNATVTPSVDDYTVDVCAGYAITYRWTAEDDCGNTAVTTATFNVLPDEIDPTFDAQPTAIGNITCIDDLPVQEVLTASDTCGNATVTPSVDDYTVDVCAGYAITYRWTAEDDCGNTAVTTATFNVLPDEIDPTFDAQPTAIGNITCIDDLPVQEVLTASDTCGNATVTPSVDDYTVDVCAGYAITYRWTAEDDCGNTAVTTATFNVLPDEIDPTFDAQPTAIGNITCIDDLPVQEVLTASDTCGNATVTPSVDDYTVDVCAGYAITYRWTAEDDCGNTAVTTATFNVLPDEIDPTFDAQPTAIGNITCIDDLPVQEVLTASDTCGNATVTPSVDDYTVDVCAGYAITYRWTAEDDCGNTAVTTATFNVLPDEIDPTFDAQPTAIGNITCIDDLPVQEVLTASDTCGNATVTPSVDDYTVDVCAGYAITYRWTAEDDCGNTAVTTATFNVLPDEIDPTFDAQPTAIGNITCIDDLPVQEVLTASDTCGNATVTPSVDDYTVDVCAGYAITYRWTAEDDCGNTAVTTATFNVLPDEIDPTFDAQPTAIGNITCIDDLPVQEVLTASDTCGNATVTPSVDDYTVDVCAGYAITYRWTAEDDCGNTAVTTATFNVLPDEIDPTFDAQPTAIGNITCIDDLPVQEVLTASDTCGNATVTPSVDDYTVDVCAGYAITYRWTAEDDCGNTAVTTATFNVLPDEIDPTFDAQPTAIGNITCIDDLPVQEVLTASDTCGNATVTPSVDDYTVDVCAGYAITYRWTAEDDCGNTAVTTATFNVLPDTTAPTIFCPADITLECTASTDPSNTGTATASDTCDANPEVTYTDSGTGSCHTGAYVITRTWTAEDDCGNEISCTQLITVAPATVSGHIYADTNGNGQQDVGEPDLEGVDVVITDSQGNLQTVTTDADGNYSAYVPAGTTIADVIESTLPVGNQYDGSQTDGEDTTTIEAIFNQINNIGIDGYQPQGTITGHIYEDTNGNGEQDAGEPDLAGVDVEITDSQGATYNVTTDAEGNYSQVVAVGDATANVDENTLPDGSQLPASHTDGDDPTIVSIPAGGTGSDLDGYQPQGTITGHIYEDTNGNGTQDAGEPDLAGVDVEITDSQGDTYNVTTDTNGNYSQVVAAGDATANVDENTLPDGSQLPASHTDGDDPTIVSIPAGGTGSDLDGYQPQGTITGHIYEDTNGNGTQDSGEPDLAGVDVEITDSQGDTYNVTTDADGNYSQVVAAGDAMVDVDDSTLPAGSALAILVQTEGNDPTTVNVPAGGTGSDIDGYNRQADVSIVKTDDGSDAVAGEQNEYTLTVSNAGPWDANDIVVVDTLPEGMSFVSAIGATIFTVADQVITFNPFDIIVGGADVVITITVDVASSVDNGTLTNTATANGIETDPDPANNEDDEPTDVVREADLSINKDDGVTEVTAGDGVTYKYTITVDNDGPSDADNVTVEDVFPTGFSMGTVSSSQGGCTAFGCNLGTIASGDSATITIQYTVPSDTQAGFETNTVTVTSDEPDPDTNNNEDEDTNEVLTDINLSIVKTFNPMSIEIPQPQGSEQEFTIVVSNAGPSDAVDVSVTDMVDTILDITDGVGNTTATVTSGSGDCSASTGQYVDCTVQIPADESVTITVTYMTAPFLDDESPYDTAAGGDDFYFVFLNGSVLEGTTRGEGLVLLDGVDITADVDIVTSLTRNDIVFDPPGSDPAFELHLSCSDPFTGGWGQSGGPSMVDDVNWQIAFFTIARFNNNGFIKSCGNVVNEFEVDNIADALGEDSSPETDDVSDIAIVTIGPGITLDRLQTKGKRVTARLTNWTGEDKDISYIEVEWPDENGKLTKVWLTQDVSTTIWQGTADSGAVLPGNFDVGYDYEAGWNGGTLMENEAILRFDFKNKVANSGYNIRVYFNDGGTWLDIDVPEEFRATSKSRLSVETTTSIMSVYPNPAQTSFNVKLEGYSGEYADILMYDMSGREIMTIRKQIVSNKDLTIDLPSSIDEGMYYVRLMNDYTVKAVPIVISK